MIVTRQRKQKKSSLPILLPIAAIAMLAIAWTWPPSRNFISNGPLKPVATVFDGVWGVISRPLSFAYQQQQITDRNQDIKTLNDKLETDRKAAADKDARIVTLQKQIATAQAEPAAVTTPVAARAVAGQPGAGAGGAAAAGQASPAIRVAAQQWSSMDPEKAAALVQKLPTTYVSTVFAQMSPDSVGPIMDALPAKVAALIVESGTAAQISAQPGR
jgi:peptidoglycan hydrolase-like protein with peptidoglycan-binding domain